MDQDLKAILGDKGTEETQTGRGKAHGFFPVYLFSRLRRV